MEKIEVTQEMLEQALLSCLEGEPADHSPCDDCYLHPLRGAADDCMIDGALCSKRLALDTIAYIRRINDFEKSQCKIMLEKLQRVKTENAQLRNVIEQMDTDFFKRKCRVCGCDWNHACPGGCSWVGDDLCSRCFSKMLGDKQDE